MRKWGPYSAMDIQPGSIDHLSQVISHAVAPAFLLGAVAGFISILLTRMSATIDRIRALNEIPDKGHGKSRLKADLPRQRRRLKLLTQAILLAIGSGVAAGILIVVAFVASLISRNHVYSVSALFVISLGFLCASLVTLALEVGMGFTEYDEH